MPTTYTPIRYPGGKSKIYPAVERIISSSGLEGCVYAEAFCGGAGLAVKLLLKGDVSRIVLNDVDPAVFSMWDAIVNHPEELCSFLAGTEPTVDEWDRQHDLLASSSSPSLELGMAALFLNRTNRSGILRGGPIGGRGQTGVWAIGARYNPDGLCAKVRRIAARSGDIELRNLDASDFIEAVLRPMATNGGRVLANFDPPYVEKGPELYQNSFDEGDHRALAREIASCEFPWVVTYDAVPLVDEMYAEFERYDLEVGYSAARVRREREILVAGPHVTVPDGLLPRRSAGTEADGTLALIGKSANTLTKRDKRRRV